MLYRPVTDVKSIIDHLESCDLGATLKCHSQIVKKVRFHSFFVVFKVSVTTTFESDFIEGSGIKVSGACLLLKAPIFLGDKKLAGLIMSLIQLTNHDGNLYILILSLARLNNHHTII